MKLSPFETTPLYIRLWGGDGDDDKQQQPDQPEVKVEVKTGGEPDNDSGDAGKPDGDDGKSDSDEFEKKFDQERKARLKLQRELDKRDQEAAKVNTDTEAELNDYKQKYEQLKAYVEKDGIDTAIMKESNKKDKDGHPKYEWHDVEAVRAFINKDNIRLDLEAGTVDGLDLELKRIAKERSYLLVPSKQPDNNDGNPADKSPANGGPASGGHPFGAGGGRQRETDSKKIGAKYKIPGFGPGAASAVRPL
jgi:hypothetical protein